MMTVYLLSLVILQLLTPAILSHGDHKVHNSLSIDPQDDHMKEHLKEHLEEFADDVNLDTENDVYFGYFNVHDTNKDGFMDGLELLASFSDHRSKAIDENYTDEHYENDLKTYTNVVDMTLKDFDANNDGLISFEEYIAKVKKPAK